MTSSCKQPTPHATTSTINDEIAAQMAALNTLTHQKEEEEKQQQLELEHVEEECVCLEQEEEKKKKKKEKKSKSKQVEDPPAVKSDSDNGGYATPGALTEVGNAKDLALQVCEVPIGCNLCACIRCSKQGYRCSFVKNSKGAGTTAGAKCKAGREAKTTQLKQQHAELSCKHNNLLHITKNQGNMINALVKASDCLEKRDCKVVHWQHGVDGFLWDKGVWVDIWEREGGGLPIPEYFGHRNGQVHGVPESAGAGMDAGASAGREAKEKEGKELEDEGEAE
ncbi:hypothetical protein DL96DRAFT_1567712 [Flagelloscypha sp. PMI_526]|nr:hypothetical protein DL96DRAFT_1567712 [Flagelloscypha sp. PMI_526]